MALIFLLHLPQHFSMIRVNQRVAVLIDTQNMYHSAKHIHGARLAFGKVVEAVAEGRPVIRAIAYVAKSKTGEETAFFDAMKEMGIELKIKDIQEFSSGAKKADWDVGIAVDAIKLSSKVDVVILMTGDGDFVPLVEYLHNHGVLVEAAAFGESTNAQLKTVVDNFFDISEHHELLIGSRLARVHHTPAPRRTDLGSNTFGLPPELTIPGPKTPPKAPQSQPTPRAPQTPPAGKGRPPRPPNGGGEKKKIRVTF